MATPMTLPDCCAVCFELYGDGVYDVLGPYEAVRVNVCIPCKMFEIRQLIEYRAAWPS